MKERKIVEYFVLVESTAERLDDSVNMQLMKGWQPLGGVSTLVEPNIVYFVQALVKYEEPQEEEL